MLPGRNQGAMRVSQGTWSRLVCLQSKPVIWGKERVTKPRAGSRGCQVRGRGSVLGGAVPALWVWGQRKRMCQERCHFDVQVVRRQGGAGLPSAVRLALAGSAHTLAGLRRPPGLSGCGFMWLCWKAPGKARALSRGLVPALIQSVPWAPAPGLLPKHRPGGNFDNYARTGLEQLGLVGLCFWPKWCSRQSQMIQIPLPPTWSLATSFLPQTCPLHCHPNSYCS